jgi:tripartite-type tricarboxylate transporter receptor subunit TctC
MKYSIMLFAALAAFSCAPAAAYPTKPVRLIVGFAPGGASDLLGRLVAQKLTESLGQTVVVDNRPSAGGIVASDIVAKANPDGHTLLVGSSAAFAITPHLTKDLPYDTRRDFTPVSMFANLTFVLLLNPKVPAKSVTELITLAKAQPGKLNYGSAGNGTTTHMVSALFAQMAGIDLVHVPYKGAGPAMVDLISGQINVLFDAAITSIPQLKSGRVRAIAVSGAKRSTLLPDVPTVAEAGLPGYTAGSWFAIFGPSRLHPAVVARLSGDIAKGMSQPEVRQELAARGAEPWTTSPEELRRFISSESDRYGKLIKLSGIRMN